MATLISRHIAYIDKPSDCWRQELRYDPPLEIDLSLGKTSSFLNSQSGRQSNPKGPLRKCKPVINANGILHINEVMKAGETMSVILRAGYRLTDIVLREVHQLLILANDQGLHYWFTVGRDGVVEITGTMVKDDDGFHAKLKSNLKDMSYRSYIVQCSLAGSKMAAEGAGRPPDVMDTQQAAKYIGRSVSWLYKRAASGEIPRTPHKRFRKVDLDAFLVGRERKGKNRKR